jgi:hypothetical protein
MAGHEKSPALSRGVIDPAPIQIPDIITAAMVESQQILSLVCRSFAPLRHLERDSV